jgi:hypothetical protein
MESRDAHQVDGHTTLSVDINVGFLSSRKIGGKAGGKETGQSLMRNVEQLWGHMRRRKVIAIA